MAVPRLNRIFISAVTVLATTLAGTILAAFSEQAADLFLKGRSEKSLQAYVSRSTKNPSDTDCIKNIIILARELGQPDRERAALESLRAHAFDDLWMLRECGWNALSRGDMAAARDDFEKALKQKPADADSLLGLGMTLYVEGHYDRAGQIFQLLADGHPGHGPASFLAGEAARLNGDTVSAEDSYRAAHKRDYSMPEIRFSRARMYLDAGKTGKAWVDIRKLGKICPKSRTVKKLIVLPQFASLREADKKAPPGRRLSGHRAVTPLADADGIPFITVGIIVGAKGAPQQSSAIRFDLRGECRIHHTDAQSRIIAAEVGSDWEVRLSAGNGIELLRDGILQERTTDKISIIPASRGNTVIVRDVPYATGYAWAGTSDREYRGEILVRRQGNRLILVNRLRLDEYVFSVLPSEMISSWPREALKSQAVIARGYAWYKKRYPVHKRYGYELCAGQHCQVYAGVGKEMKQTNDAVLATLGEALLFSGRTANTLYSSNCGGITQSSKDLKGWGDEPYLTGVPDMADARARPLSPLDLYEWIRDPAPDIYCAPSKHTYGAESRWIRVVPAELVSERADRRYRTGKIHNIRIERRSPSGHIRALTLAGSRKKVTLEKENHIRGVPAPGGLRSTYYTVRIVRRDGEPQFFVFYGGGWGHTIGMCQSGAAGMAEKGRSYREILKHYYKGTKISGVY